jgi:hypothetical protein
MSYTQILFSIVESKFRLFLMAIDPNALGKKYYFYDVYTCLLKRVEKTQYQEFIRFFSLIRNTIHNDGVYVKASKRYNSSEYSGKTYEFNTMGMSNTLMVFVHLICYCCKSRLAIDNSTGTGYIFLLIRRRKNHRKMSHYSRDWLNPLRLSRKTASFNN